jgi:hypothetical protein
MKKILLLGVVLVLLLGFISCDPDNGNKVCPPHDWGNWSGWDMNNPVAGEMTRQRTCSRCTEIDKQTEPMSNGLIYWDWDIDGELDNEDSTKIIFTFTRDIEGFWEETESNFKNHLVISNVTGEIETEYFYISDGENTSIWELGFTVIEQGDITIKFDLEGIEDTVKTITVFKDATEITIREELRGSYKFPEHPDDIVQFHLGKNYFQIAGIEELTYSATIDEYDNLWINVPGAWTEPRMLGTFTKIDIDNNIVELETLSIPDFINWGGRIYVKIFEF